MNSKYVKDIMLPIKDYPSVKLGTSLFEAILQLSEAQRQIPKDLQPFRAVLVVDENNKIIGKIGQLAFLKGLEPRYSSLGDLQILSKAGISPELINSMVEHLSFWDDSLTEICQRAKKIKVEDVMHPASENIDENATLAEAGHKIVMTQALSILVNQGSTIVGILRLSDLFSEITNIAKGLVTEA